MSNDDIGAYSVYSNDDIGAYSVYSNDDIGAYRQVFQCLKRRIRQNHSEDFQPRYNAISDFEQALIAAMETEFPRTSLRGCYFHFSQSLWRKVQQLGLRRAYRVDVALKRKQSVKRLPWDTYQFS